MAITRVPAESATWLSLGSPYAPLFSHHFARPLPLRRADSLREAAACSSGVRVSGGSSRWPRAGACFAGSGRDGLERSWVFMRGPYRRACSGNAIKPVKTTPTAGWGCWGKVGPCAAVSSKPLSAMQPAWATLAGAASSTSLPDTALPLHTKMETAPHPTTYSGVLISSHLTGKNSSLSCFGLQTQLLG